MIADSISIMSCRFTGQVFFFFFWGFALDFIEIFRFVYDD